MNGSAAGTEGRHASQVRVSSRGCENQRQTIVHLEEQVSIISIRMERRCAIGLADDGGSRTSPSLICGDDRESRDGLSTRSILPIVYTSLTSNSCTDVCVLDGFANPVETGATCNFNHTIEQSFMALYLCAQQSE